MSPDEFMRPITSIPLQAHVEELRRRCEAVAHLQGGYPSYLEQVSLFRRYATETRLAFHTPLELSRQADEEGNEHQVWFCPPIAYFDPIARVVISDTHRGNIILMEDGLLAPIDLRVQPLQGALLDAVVKLCGIRN
jgi:hypothetical protein